MRIAIQRKIKIIDALAPVLSKDAFVWDDIVDVIEGVETNGHATRAVMQEMMTKTGHKRDADNWEEESYVK